MKKITKTNALRMLDKHHINYVVLEYEYDEEHLSGDHILHQVDLAASQIYKTLVLQDHDRHYLVCCIPILEEIDLKKLAKVAHVKNVAMIHQKDLLSVTGYIRGGCSPVGMKKQFPTYFQEDILKEEKAAFSAGKRGMQVVLKPQDMIDMVQGQLVSVIKE